jgi:hypothetical protein
MLGTDLVSLCHVYGAFCPAPFPSLREGKGSKRSGSIIGRSTHPWTDPIPSPASGVGRAAFGTYYIYFGASTVGGGDR